MIITPMKCKLCGKTISPPDEALIIGEADGARKAKLIAELTQHIVTEGNNEVRRNGPNEDAGPHTAAICAANKAAQHLGTALMVNCFDVSPDLDTDRLEVFRRIHAVTRTVRIPDTELERLSKDCDCEGGECTWDAVLEVLKDLRDRYEGLGKYAPPIHTQETVKTQ